MITGMHCFYVTKHPQDDFNGIYIPYCGERPEGEMTIFDGLTFLSGHDGRFIEADTFFWRLER